MSLRALEDFFFSFPLSERSASLYTYNDINIVNIRRIYRRFTTVFSKNTRKKTQEHGWKLEREAESKAVIYPHFETVVGDITFGC